MGNALARHAKVYQLLNRYFAGPSCLLGSFFCFFVSSEAAFAFLDSLLLFCSFSFDITNTPIKAALICLGLIDQQCRSLIYLRVFSAIAVYLHTIPYLWGYADLDRFPLHKDLTLPITYR
jgi:hypothetical protein